MPRSSPLVLLVEVSPLRPSQCRCEAPESGKTSNITAATTVEHGVTFHLTGTFEAISCGRGKPTQTCSSRCQFAAYDSLKSATTSENDGNLAWLPRQHLFRDRSSSSDETQGFTLEIGETSRIHCASAPLPLLVRV